MGGEMNMRSSMSVSFCCVVCMYWCCCCLCHVHVVGDLLKMGTTCVASFVSMFALEVTCKYIIAPPQAEPLDDFSRGTIQC